jgi:2-oxoglutarate dehydrogenase E2 component (dihydrolipoamide succinyltransferase)
MTIEVKVPVLPESVEDATIAGWHKSPGDTIHRDENLVDLETDKVVLEVPAPVDGTVRELRAQEGDTVNSDDVIAVIEEGDIEAAEAVEAARRVAEEEKVDPSQVEGTGRGGRVTKGDVVNFVRSGGLRQEERVKMTRLRSRIAERMKDAQNTAAILTSFNEVDLKAVMDLRRKYQDAFTARHGIKLGLMSFFVTRHGIKLGLMSFFVKACCEALRKHPVVNASMDGDEIVYHNYQDIGIAVSTDRGLMVPVIRNAENMGLAEIEQAIAHYAGKARDGSITLDDLQGGTFSITNGGIFGSLVSTPLLNPPQSAILGMHTIKDRPVVVDGEIVARPMMFLAISYDHRLIDGKDAVQFLVAVKESLEDPARMLLGL